MANEVTWLAVGTEFEQLCKNNSYTVFRPILEKLRPLIEVGKTSPNLMDHHALAQALLDVVKYLQTRSQAGADVQVLVEQISGGYVQPDWYVRGDVKQANQDFIDKSRQYITNIFTQASPELKITANADNIPVPIVVVAMTQTEAHELKSKAAFQDTFLVLQDAFDELDKHLTIECSDWLNRYGARAQDWKPFGSKAEGATVEQLTTKALEGLENDPGLERIRRPLVPSFIDVRTLIDPEHRLTLRRLREKGCIVIVDVISLRHPTLQRAFHRTLLDAFSRTSVVSFAPNERLYQAAARLTIVIQFKIEEMEFHQRIADTGDYGQCEQLYGAMRLRPWLSSRVQKLQLPEPDRPERPWL
jgi:hypothetical protein